MNHDEPMPEKVYDPNQLLDALLKKLNLRNDAALARVLEVQPPMISKIRHRRLPVSAALIVRIHDITGMSVREIRELMGDRRAKYRFGDAQGKPLLLESNSGNRPESAI